MPVKRTKAKCGRRLDEYRLQQLVDGPDACLLAGVGYLTAGTFDAMSLDDKAATLDQMRDDWARQRDDVLHWWRSRIPMDGAKPWIQSQLEGDI